MLVPLLVGPEPSDDHLTGLALSSSSAAAGRAQTWGGHSLWLCSFCETVVLTSGTRAPGTRGAV